MKCFKAFELTFQTGGEECPKINISPNKYESFRYFMRILCEKGATLVEPVKSGDPPGAGKIWENRFFTGKIDQMTPKNGQK